MPRRKMNIPGLNIAPAPQGRGRTPMERLEIASDIRDALEGMGVKPNGTAASQRPEGRPVFDPDWAADLDEFVVRSEPHNKMIDGVPTQVSLDLTTLRVIVDRNNEVVAWHYSES